MSKRTPVAVFAYNRPQHTHRALEALSRCRNLEDCDFHFFADGPRAEQTRVQVDATRAVLREWAGVFGAQLVERENNLGLARSIGDGVSDLCARYGRVVVVEDDLVVSPDFVHYMVESLDRYEDDVRVMQVGGCTLRAPNSLATDVFLLPVTTTWGWATWQRAWRHFSITPHAFAEAQMDREWSALFNLHGAVDFSAMLQTRLAGGNDSWGILWWYAVSRLRGLVAYPAQSLVWNGGFDGSGIHCGNGDALGQPDPSTHGLTRLPEHLTFPPLTRYEPGHLTQLENFFRAISASPVSLSLAGSPARSFRTMAQSMRARLRRVLG